MKLYTKRYDNGEFIEVGEATQISKNIDSIFIRLNTLLRPVDAETVRKDIEKNIGKKCVVVDRGIELDHAE